MNTINFDNTIAPISSGLGVYELISMDIVKTRGYQDQFIRPLTPNVKHYHIQAIEEKVYNNKYNINAGIIANELSDVLMPNKAPIAAARIDGGWNNERAIFTAVFSRKVSNGEDLYYITGYTNGWGISKSGALAPDMKFIINNIAQVRRAINPMDGSISLRPLGFWSVHYDPVSGTYNYGNNEILMLASPDLVIESMATREMLDLQTDNLQPTVINTIPKLSKNSSPVRKDMNTPSIYMSTLVSGLIGGAIMSGSEDDSVVNNAATSMSRFALANTPPIIAKITQITNDPAPVFLAAHLEQINGGPIDPSRIHVYTRMDSIREVPINTIDTMESEDLSKATLENSLVTLIVESITGFMVESSLLSIVLSGSNLTGEYIVEPLSARSFIEGFDIAFLAEKVKQKFITMVMPTLTYQNQLEVQFIADINLMGDSFIQLSVNNGPMIPYRIPTFADATFAPVITTEVGFNEVTRMAETIKDAVVSAVDTKFIYNKY